MLPILAQIADLIAPLDRFDASASPPDVCEIRGDEIPMPHRRLLVHDNDMTSTLERFFGRRLNLRVLEAGQNDDELVRKVVLLTDGDETLAEFGAIRIHLALFTAAAREQIVEGRRPLGSILEDHAIRYRCDVVAWFRIRPDEAMRAVFGLDGDHELFGRTNVISNTERQRLAEVVEILPPLGVADPEGER